MQVGHALTATVHDSGEVNVVVNGPRLVRRDIIGVFSCAGETIGTARYLGEAFKI